jgi:hypothetical protein
LSLRYQFFLTVIFSLITAGFYAIYTDQTGGDLCRHTGHGIASIGQYTDGPEAPVAAASQLIKNAGHKIEDGCSRY